MGSNTCRNLEESLTQVSFLVNDQNPLANPNVRNITVELTKSELKQLISTIQRSLDN